MKFSIILIFIIILITSCVISDPVEFPFDDYDYTLSQLNLGIAFPPSSTSEYRTFSIEHMNILGLNLLRLDQTWAFREPENDVFNWQPLLDRVNNFSDEGKKILLTMEIKSFPDWTASLDSMELKDEFREYAAELLSLIGGKLEYIQFGNEWNWEIDSYFNGDENSFIELANILYSEVFKLPLTNRPQVVLGSLSMGALQSLAFEQNRIANVFFDNSPLYTESELESAQPGISATVLRMNNIVSNVNFEAIDLHFYDEFWNWGIYLVSISQLITETGKDPVAYPVIASEFGGPYPVFESNDAASRAKSLISYVQTLDALGIKDALFFKLVEESTAPIAHPNSFLLDEDLNKTLRYEVMRRFGN